ncbi:4Fe-4S dicluster domain-containing protein [Candidatus Pacearchaeota archaeon]|nr:4Fe-4S dicluster domain-containing protein [Candidatus Pacearchaeota archaeon]
MSNLEIENAREEIKEIVEKCVKCGMCRSVCPVLRVMREEQFSPRGKAIILENNFFEKIVYDCNLCKACEKKCPLNLELCSAFISARKILVLNKKEIPENKEMIKNLNKTGNIFGIQEFE